MASIKIEGLTEQLTVADDEYLVIGNGEAKKIKAGVFSAWIFEALGLNHIGEIITANNTSTISLNADTISEICSITVPAGTYLVIGSVAYNPDEITTLAISTDADYSTIVLYKPHISDDEAMLAKVFTFDNETTLYLGARGTGSVYRDGRINCLQATRIM